MNFKSKMGGGGSGYGSTEPTEQCRTCKGTGKITRKDKEGIAVIAYGDERLAPSKTAIYIAVGVLVFLAVTLTLVVLFYPRTVSANSKKLVITKARITQTESSIMLQDSVNMVNKNYFSTSLHQINISVTFQLKEIGTNQTSYNSSGGVEISIPARHTHPVNFSIAANLSKDTGSEDIWAYCCNRTSFGFNLPFQVQVNTEFKYFSNTFEYSDQALQTTNCPNVTKSKTDNKTCLYNWDEDV